MCIEVKNYTKPIPSKEIDKYHNSLSLPDYHAGVMISMNQTGFAREYRLKTPIDIRIINGKPSAYVTCIDPQLLYPIIVMLTSMIKDYDSTNIQDSLNEKIKALADIFDRVKDIRVCIEAQKKSTMKMESLINDIAAISIQPSML